MVAILHYLFFAALTFAVATLTSCAVPRQPSSTPSLEVQQVMHRWEVVVRLNDFAATKNPACGIFVVLKDEKGKKLEAHVADLSLKKTTESGEFIGIYSNGKEFSHGTEVIAIYRRGTKDAPLRAATRMFYH